MQSSHIREGTWYAISTKPRKGIKPENLHKVESIVKAKCVAKNEGRFAEHAKDAWGDPDGNYKHDGIRVQRDGTHEDETFIIKPRDVLMPWSEYRERVERDDAEQNARIADLNRRAEEAREATVAVTERLVDMGLIEQGAYGTPEYEVYDFQVYNDHQVRMPIKSMNALLDTVSSRVYELLANAE